MKRTIAAILFGLCVGAWAIASDAQSTAQGSASSQSAASAQANKQGAQASGNASGAAAAQSNKPAAQATGNASGSGSAQANKQGAQASGNATGAAAAQAGRQSAALTDGTTMNAALTSPVDAKKNKPGDPVHAKTTQATKSNGQVVIPKGSKLEGHVTEAKARGKSQSDSSLGVVFDKAILKNGQEVPLNVAVQALASAQTMASETGPIDNDSLAMGGAAAGGARTTGGAGRTSGGALGGVTSTAGGAAGSAGQTTGTVGAVGNTAGNVGGAAGGAVGTTTNVAGATRGAVGGLNSAGQLTSNSQGVFGLSGITLQSIAASNAQGSLITSTTHNVHLDSGTQLLLVATGAVQAQAADQ